MKDFLFLIGMTVALTSLYLWDYSNFEAQAMDLPVIKEGPFVCEKWDQIMKVSNCKRSMKCTVLLKSGREIIYHAPIIDEIVPCEVESI